MKHLLLPLRAKSLSVIHPVVILYPEPMPIKIWSQICDFPRVHYIQGSPGKPADLNRAGIKNAAAVVILSKVPEADSSKNNQVDADSIFVYKTVKHMNKNVRIITELSSVNTISLLSSTTSDFLQKVGYFVSEPFASGEVYISSMLDTLMCQVSIWLLMIYNNSS
jgi:potassium large conductance calcium-activated channel subfamily M alpha protein 1